MAIIGFIAIILIACYFAVFAIGGAFVGLGFAGKIEPILIVPAAISAGIFYYAFTHAPFAISFITK